MTLFLMAINDILGELRNGVDESLFADNLVLYTVYHSKKPKDDSYSTAMSYQQVRYLGIRERTNPLYKQNSKHDI